MVEVVVVVVALVLTASSESPQGLSCFAVSTVPCLCVFGFCGGTLAGVGMSVADTVSAAYFSFTSPTKCSPFPIGIPSDRASNIFCRLRSFWETPFCRPH